MIDMARSGRGRQMKITGTSRRLAREPPRARKRKRKATGQQASKLMSDDVAPFHPHVSSGGARRRSPLAAARPGPIVV